MEPPLSAVFGHALTAAFDWTWPRLSPGLKSLLRSLGEKVVPDPPMTIRTSEGDIVSGFLIVDRGHVLAFVGTRRPGSPAFRSSPPRGGDESFGYGGDYER